jgi:hypothetical protein
LFYSQDNATSRVTVDLSSYGWGRKVVPQEFRINKNEQERFKSLTMICEHNQDVKDGKAPMYGFCLVFI